MRTIVLVAVLALLPGCQSLSYDPQSAWDSIWDCFGSWMNDSAYHAAGESDRARFYRKQQEQNPGSWER